MEQNKNPINDLLLFIDASNQYFKDHQYIVTPENDDVVVKNYKTIFINNDSGLSANIALKGDAHFSESYIAAFEIEHINKEVFINLRMKDYCVIWNGKFGYCTNLKKISVTQAFEYKDLRNIQYCNDLDSSTIFQYRIIEEKADDILVLLNKLREMVDTEKYRELINASFRKK